MRLVIQREKFLRPLQLVSGVVERKQMLPILSNILLSLDKQELSIIATDLEVELKGRVILNEATSDCCCGEITVSAKKLMDICRSLSPESKLELVTEKNNLLIYSGKSHFTLSTMPVNEFPNIEERQIGKLSFSLPQKKLKELIEKTYFSMAQQDVRYYLNGILFIVNQNVIKFVSADGHRLSSAFLSNIDINNQNQIFQAIVPKKGVMELMRLLDDVDDIIKINLGSNHIYVSAQEFTFASKLIEGKFPSHEKNIPRNGNKEIIIESEKLKQALTRVSILSNETYRGIRLLLSENLLKLSANNPEQEEAEEELKIDYLGADLEIGFNVNYLLDVCNAVTSAEIKMTFSDANGGILIEEVDKNNFAYVVMPMRL